MSKKALQDIQMLVNIARKCAQRLVRDAIEVENLQSSPISAQRFINIAHKTLEEKLLKELSKAREDHKIIFGAKEFPKEQGDYFLIESLDGKLNLSHGIHDFALVILHYKIDENGANTQSTLIYNPVKDEAITAITNLGAFKNELRIRVSNRKLSDHLATATNGSRLKNLKKSTNYQLNCPSLDAANLACGKYDLIVLKSDLPLTIIESAKLLNKESGGRFEQKSKNIIFSNSQLFGKV